MKIDNKAYANIVPIVLAVIIVFSILFIGAYIMGTVHSELEDALGEYSANTTEASVSLTMNNTSWNFDSALDIFQVVIIITILSTAIGAIFLFTRYR